MFKESKIKIHPKNIVLTDTGYQGLKKFHFKTKLPIKKSKKRPLTKEMKKYNKLIASDRILNENRPLSKLINLILNYKSLISN